MTYDYDRADYEMRHRVWQAHQMLTDHELLDETHWQGGARWVIGNRETIVGRTEIVAGVFQSLIVHGDFPFCRFAYAGRRDSPRAVLDWMASHQLPDSYVCEKAHIGTGALLDADRDGYDEVVALSDLARRVAEEEESDTPDRALIEVLCGALPFAESREELRRYLYEHDDGWDLWEWDPGRVVPWRVVLAHACIQRCASLLDARARAA